MPQAQGINPLMQMFPLVLVFIVFYFMLIRPQKTKEKEHLNMLSKLAKNDEVVTSSGIHGTIVNVKDKTVTLRIDENVKVEIDKASIAYKKSSTSSA